PHPGSRVDGTRQTRGFDLPDGVTLGHDRRLQLVDADLYADRAILLLQQPRVLAPQYARGRHENMELQRLPILVADPVAIVIAPAMGAQNPGRLRRVIGQLPDVGVPDPQQLRHGARRDLRQFTARALQQAGAIHRHGERTAHVPVREGRVRQRAVIRGALVEPQEGVNGATVGVYGERPR